VQLPVLLHGKTVYEKVDSHPYVKKIRRSREFAGVMRIFKRNSRTDITSRTFCILPWVHATTLTDGRVSLCCVARSPSEVNLNEQTFSDYWNSDYVKDARRRMLAGERVKVCERCYQEESQGYKSLRRTETEGWQEQCGQRGIRELIDNTAADGTLNASLQYIDLRLGNTCNMQCLMCRPQESSRWMQVAQRMSEISQQSKPETWHFSSPIERDRFEWYRNEEFWSNLKTLLPHMKEVVLAGGEPFLIKEQFAFVKTCCETGDAGHIRLRYHTNGTIFTDELIPFWKQFERVHFFISLDGIGDVANYVRHPTDWKQIQENIARFDGLGANTMTIFHFSTHALNVYRIPELLEWARTSDLKNRLRFPSLQDYVRTSLVHYPDYQNVRVLPTPHKDVVSHRIRRYMETRLAGQRVDKLTAILDFMNSADDSSKLPTLVKYTEMLDQARNTNFSATFPELAPYWPPYDRR
jgi:molybdenum cofactor biosynthesis enzyme MoaA